MINRIIFSRLLRDFLLILAFSVFVFFSCTKDDNDGTLPEPATLPDLSGLSWITSDLFIGVHDAKNSDTKKDWPRLSLIRLPQSEFEGVIWQPFYPAFPGPGGLSSDMESCSSIPGGKDFLFVESGQEGEDFRRIFHGSIENDQVSIIDYVDWPVEITNVEATEVCLVGDQLVFLYAERAQDSSWTKIRWTEFTLDPLGFGDFREVVYAGIDPVGPGTRPIVAMDIDSDGMIYIVSAYDSGNDGGPFRSVVWQIGNISDDTEGNPMVYLGLNTRLANLDGLKVESIAIREMPGSNKEIYIGTDDEHYGGIMRLLPGKSTGL